MYSCGWWGASALRSARARARRRRGGARFRSQYAATRTAELCSARGHVSGGWDRASRRVGRQRRRQGCVAACAAGWWLALEGAGEGGGRDASTSPPRLRVYCGARPPHFPRIIPAADKLTPPVRASASSSRAPAPAPPPAPAPAASAWEEGRVIESEPDADGIITIVTHTRNPETSAKQRVRTRARARGAAPRTRSVPLSRLHQSPLLYRAPPGRPQGEALHARGARAARRARAQ